MNIELPLVSSTPVEWLQPVLADFDSFLLDHASCERKAAALAMSFVVKYPDRRVVVEPMVALAREELEHFQQVFKLICRRQLVLPQKDTKDQYVNTILDSLRHGREERFLDRLVMSGMIEARGYERFHLLAEHLTDPELKSFYHGLANREAGHYRIFIRIAEHYFSSEVVQEAVERIAGVESQAMLAAPLTSRLH